MRRHAAFRLDCPTDQFSAASLILIFTLLASTIAKADSSQYQVRYLGRMRVSTFMIPVQINNGGQVVGWEKGARGAADRRGFLWIKGRFTDLGVGAAYGINNSGVVAGQNEHYLPDQPWNSSYKSYLFANGKMQSLDTGAREHAIGFEAVGINDSGAVISRYNYLWQNGSISLTAENFVQEAINSEGDIAGALFAQVAYPGPIVPEPAVSRQGKMTVLEAPPGGSGGEATGINSQDEAIGEIYQLAGYRHTSYRAVLWSAGQASPLPPCAGDSYTIANSINEHADIVGKSGAHVGYSRAVLWRAGQAIDLNTLIPADSGWILEAAHGINDAGEIVGVGTYRGRHFRAFLLTPKP